MKPLAAVLFAALRYLIQHYLEALKTENPTHLDSFKQHEQQAGYVIGVVEFKLKPK